MGFDSADEDDSMLSTSVRSMFMDLKRSLTSIDYKMYQLTNHMDRLKEKVDNHGNRIDQLEYHTSALDDEQHTASGKLLQIEKVLKLIHNKNEDLEARSRRNNICIVGIPESASMDRIEDYVEAMQ
ncbi:hypothetical protein NDU88_006770 [Pleurodeles waltl]|uniref:Uncharacterized protein n=1 Tax=Pleurodeles waltl TaxID=8319 RepID=A0AAV7WGL0_PLEWA|nr:hypothetical protein NDU88_006770 [Pleurodeles waltl]